MKTYLLYQKTINIVFAPMVIYWSHFRKLVEIEVIRSERRFGTDPNHAGHMILLEEKTGAETESLHEYATFFEWLPWRLERILKTGR